MNIVIIVIIFSFRITVKLVWLHYLINKHDQIADYVRIREQGIPKWYEELNDDIVLTCCKVFLQHNQAVAVEIIIKLIN